MHLHHKALSIVALIAASLLAAPLAVSQNAAPPSPPNIIVILADDLGYGDLGVQGGKDVATPHIDKLASEGVRLTDFYANHPVCAPSRAALMTGQYQQRFGFENNPGRPEATSPTFGLPLDGKTLPERLRRQGYTTGMFGKWHIGATTANTPTARGFDEFYGFLGGAMAYMPKGPTGSKIMLRGASPTPMPMHTTEAFASEAISFIDANKSRPFFAYLSFNAVHAPMQSTQAYLDRFAAEKDPQRRAHLAMLAAMDDAVGDIVDAVDRNGIAGKTLIVFLSDNGGPTWQTSSSNGPLNGVKALTLEGGIRVPAVFRWTGVLPQGAVINSVAMEFDVTATALAVAGATAGPDIDGVDLMPFLTGARKGDAHDKLFWRSNEQGAMRSGKWKLLKVADVYYLFDLHADMGEHKNLGAANSAKLNELKAEWLAWSASMMAPKWAGLGGLITPERTAGLKDLVERYVKGLPVDPKPLLYGGGPE